MTSGVTDTPRPGRPPAAGGVAWHTLGADQVLHSEGVDGRCGLSSAEAAARAQRSGSNKLAAGKAEPRWHAFGRQYNDPMQIGLLAAGIVRDGELIGDPTEGALVVLAAKGGIAAVSTRERYPRIAELPFDAAYKLMATFHTMKDASGREVIRCFVKGAPDQLLARAATAADTGPVPADGEFRQRYLAENQRLGQQGLRVIAIARKEVDPQLVGQTVDHSLHEVHGLGDPERA